MEKVLFKYLWVFLIPGGLGSVALEQAMDKNMRPQDRFWCALIALVFLPNILFNKLIVKLL